MIIRRVLGILVLSSIALALSTDAAPAKLVDLFKNKDGTRVRYTVVRPFLFIKLKAYPAIIAFQGRRQDIGAAKAAISNFCGEEARKRRFFICVTEAPKGSMLYQKEGFLAPELIEHFKKQFKTADEKFHMAWHINGCLSKFGIVLKSQKRIQYLTGFPDFPAYTRDYQ